MKITSIEGHEWPIEIQCRHCKSGLQIDSPEDLTMHREYKFDNYQAVMQSSYFTVSCPLCSAENRLPFDKIPTLIAVLAGRDEPTT